MIWLLLINYCINITVGLDLSLNTIHTDFFVLYLGKKHIYLNKPLMLVVGQRCRTTVCHPQTRVVSESAFLSLKCDQHSFDRAYCLDLEH